MKTCPICKAMLFDDMEVCYGCMHRFPAEDWRKQEGLKPTESDLEALSRNIEEAPQRAIEDKQVALPTAKQAALSSLDSGSAVSAQTREQSSPVSTEESFDNKQGERPASSQPSQVEDEVPLGLLWPNANEEDLLWRPCWEQCFENMDDPCALNSASAAVMAETKDWTGRVPEVRGSSYLDDTIGALRLGSSVRVVFDIDKTLPCKVSLACLDDDKVKVSIMRI